MPTYNLTAVQKPGARIMTLILIASILPELKFECNFV